MCVFISCFFPKSYQSVKKNTNLVGVEQEGEEGTTEGNYVDLDLQYIKVQIDAVDDNTETGHHTAFCRPLQ